ncbi:hypothetical protein ACHAXN_013383 [Cyclotella atomus]
MKILDRTTPTPTNTADNKPPRVSFATSPDKTIDSTPPSSPEHAALTRASGTYKTDEAIEHDEDDEFIRSKPVKPLSALRVNKILCRVPSHGSNISDLSASLSPSYVRAKPAEVQEQSNPLYALLNACGIDEIGDLISASNNATNIMLVSEKSAPKPKVPKNKKLDKPAVWGLAPSMEGDDDTDAEEASPDEEEGQMSTSVEYDNVELVLDESAFPPPPPPPSAGRRSPFSGNGILKKKVSDMVNKSGRYSPKSETANAAPSVIISPQEKKREPSPAQSDHRISHTYDVASFQNEMLRPSPVDLVLDDARLEAATAAVVAALAGSKGCEKEGNSARSSPADSIAGEVNQLPEDVVENHRVEKKTKSSKSSKGSKASKASAVSTESKASAQSTESTDKKSRSKSLPSEPSRKFLKGLPSFKRSKSAAKKGKNETEPQAEAEQAQEIAVESTTEISSAEPSKKKRFGKKKSASPTTETKDAPATESPETIEDAKHWKATLDPNSSQTYYYHTKTKVTTWEKPAGFDEAQKLKEENKFWKATVDPNSGQTYYYHSKTKEVRWTKPAGFVEKKRKKKDASKEAAADSKKEKSENEAKAANVGDEVVAESVTDKASSPVNKEMKATEDVAAPSTPLNELKDDEPVVDEPTEPMNIEPKEAEDNSEQPPVVERVNSIEDAPFDEPISSRGARQDSPLDTTDDDTFGSLPSITNDVNALDMEPIDFTSRTKTFMSQMTDKTPRFNNLTTTVKNKDFTNTNIDVNVTSDSRAQHEEEDHPSSLDSSLASTDKHSPSKTRMAQVDAVASARAAADKLKSKNAQAAKNDSFDEEGSAVFDDWSDEVSELSGIGNEENAAMKKLLIGRSARKSKSSRDNRADKSSARNKSFHHTSRSGSDNAFSQQELDSFIAKDDWGSVSKYISEMRNNRQKATRTQPSTRQIQKAIKSHRRMESNDTGPRKKFGAKSQMQRDNMEDDYSESPSDSHSSNSNDSSYDDSTFEEEESPRCTGLPKHRSRRQVT